SRREGPGL
ncbi:hypothetical protein BN1723_020841, partial [Verticillium longisporum]